jgi:hypothetical protein
MKITNSHIKCDLQNIVSKNNVSAMLNRYGFLKSTILSDFLNRIFFFQT